MVFVILYQGNHVLYIASHVWRWTHLKQPNVFDNISLKKAENIWRSNVNQNSTNYSSSNSVLIPASFLNYFHEVDRRVRTVHHEVICLLLSSMGILGIIVIDIWYNALLTYYVQKRFEWWHKYIFDNWPRYDSCATPLFYIYIFQTFE